MKNAKKMIKNRWYRVTIDHGPGHQSRTVYYRYASHPVEAEAIKETFNNPVVETKAVRLPAEIKRDLIRTHKGRIKESRNWLRYLTGRLRLVPKSYLPAKVEAIFRARAAITEAKAWLKLLTKKEALPTGNKGKDKIMKRSEATRVTETVTPAYAESLISALEEYLRYNKKGASRHLNRIWRIKRHFEAVSGAQKITLTRKQWGDAKAILCLYKAMKI